MNFSLRIRLLSAAVILLGGLSLMNPPEAWAAESCSVTVGSITCIFIDSCSTLECCIGIAEGSAVQECGGS